MKKRTACLVALMLSMTMALTGCSAENQIDAAAEAVNVDGVSIPLGEVNFLLRYQQTQLSGYSSYFGENFMNQDLMGTGGVYGETVRDTVVETLEEYYLVEAHAEELGLSLTEEEKAAAEAAAETFLAANDSETLEKMTAEKETVVHVLDLMALRGKAFADRAATIDTNVTDEEAAQKTISYVRVSTSAAEDEDGNTAELTEEELAEKKETLLAIQKEAEESGDLEAAASAHELSAVTTSYGADDTSLNEALKTAAEALSDGEYAEIVEWDNAYYLVRMDDTFDEEETEKEKENILSERKEAAYAEWLDSLKEAAEITRNEETIAALTFGHVFMQKTAEIEETDEAEVTEEESAEADEAEEAAQE